MSENSNWIGKLRSEGVKLLHETIYRKVSMFKLLLGNHEGLIYSCAIFDRILLQSWTEREPKTTGNKIVE